MPVSPSNPLILAFCNACFFYFDIRPCNACVFGIVRQSELSELRHQTAEWIPPPVALHDHDLRRAEQEAAAAVKLMRASDDKVHASRLLNLKETLATIREGGAARLKADKDAAAVSCISSTMIARSARLSTF